MNSIKKLAGQTVIYGLSSIIGRFLNWLLTPLYTRLFLPETYSIVTNMYAYVAFLIIILTYGLETGFFYFSEKEKNTKKVYSTAIISLFFTSLIFMVLASIYSQPIANLLQYPAHNEYIIWLALIIGIDAFLSIPFAKLRREEKAIKFVTIKLINILTNIGFNLFFLVLCRNVVANNPESILSLVYSEKIGVGYVFISNLIASIITLLILLPETVKIELEFDLGLLKKMLKYSLPLLVVGFAGQINENFDKIIIPFLDPSTNPREQLGIYGANYKIAVLMTMFIQAFRYSAEPFFFARAKEKNAPELYARIMKYFIIFALFIFLAVTMYIDIVKYFIDKEYYSGLKIVPIILMANLFLGIFYNLSIWYKLNNLTQYGAYLAIFGAVITLILNFLLIPIIGYIGAAWATFACYISMTILSFFIGRKFYPVNYDILNILFYFLIALFLFFTSKFITFNNNIFSLLFNSFLFCIYIIIVIYKEKFFCQINR